MENATEWMHINKSDNKSKKKKMVKETKKKQIKLTY